MKNLIALYLVLGVGCMGWADLLPETTPPPVVHNSVKAVESTAEPLMGNLSATHAGETQELIAAIDNLSAGAGVNLPPFRPEGPAQCADASLRGWICKMFAGESTWEAQMTGGTQMLRVGSALDIAPAVGLVIRPAPRAGGGGNSWSFEVGSMIPHTVSGDFQQVQQTVGNTRYDARIDHLWELHLAANYTLPHGEQSWVVPDAGFGVSMLHLTNRIDTVTNQTYLFDGNIYSYQTAQRNREDTYSFSPLFRLGVTLFAEYWINLHADAAYVGYADTFGAQGQLFDLGFSGVMVRSLLLIRF